VVPHSHNNSMFLVPIRLILVALVEAKGLHLQGSPKKAKEQISARTLICFFPSSQHDVSLRWILTL
jgi:hypothetical protein